MSSRSSISCKKMNSVKNKPAQERRRVGPSENGDWNCNEWEKYRHQPFCCRFGVDWGMPRCCSMSDLPLHLLGDASLKRAGDEHGLIREADWTGKGGHPVAPAHMAEKGMDGTAGAQEDVVMGKSSGRGTKKDRGYVQSDHRRLLQQAPEKCLNTGPWSHLPNLALTGFILMYPCSCP